MLAQSTVSLADTEANCYYSLSIPNCRTFCRTSDYLLLLANELNIKVITTSSIGVNVEGLKLTLSIAVA